MRSTFVAVPSPCLREHDCELKGVRYQTPMALGSLVFKTAALNHSATLPAWIPYHLLAPPDSSKWADCDRFATDAAPYRLNPDRLPSAFCQDDVAFPRAAAWGGCGGNYHVGSFERSRRSRRGGSICGIIRHRLGRCGHAKEYAEPFSIRGPRSSVRVASATKPDGGFFW